MDTLEQNKSKIERLNTYRDTIEDHRDMVADLLVKNAVSVLAKRPFQTMGRHPYSWRAMHIETAHLIVLLHRIGIRPKNAQR